MAFKTKLYQPPISKSLNSFPSNTPDQGPQDTLISSIIFTWLPGIVFFAPNLPSLFSPQGLCSSRPLHLEDLFLRFSKNWLLFTQDSTQKSSPKLGHPIWKSSAYPLHCIFLRCFAFLMIPYAWYYVITCSLSVSPIRGMTFYYLRLYHLSLQHCLTLSKCSWHIHLCIWMDGWIYITLKLKG